MKRVFNFCAGPAALPESVLLRAQEELLDWHNHGLSVMEMSHRGSEFIAIAKQAEQDLRDLLAVPTNYRILFLQGGARTQFATIPMNLLADKKAAGYVNTGHWSKHAIHQAKTYCDVNIVAELSETKLIPPENSWPLNDNLAYVHYVANETIDGIAFHAVPQVGQIPLVSDMSSNILSQPIDVSKFGLIYAGAQKNIGPAGLTIVIVREDLLGRAMAITPQTFNYQTQAEHDSMYNTPPTFAWYLAGLVFQWLKAQGGLDAIAKINQRKAQKLYQAIDQSDFYFNKVDKSVRSIMNIPFSLHDEDLSQKFLEEAKQNGLLYLKGHAAVGGMRASIYNAVSENAVDTLINFMSDFEKRYG